MISFMMQLEGENFHFESEFVISHMFKTLIFAIFNPLIELFKELCIELDVLLIEVQSLLVFYPDIKGFWKNNFLCYDYLLFL